MAPQVSPGLPPVASTQPTRTTANRVAQASCSFPTHSQHGKHDTGLHAIQAKAILPLHNIVRSNSETENNPETIEPLLLRSAPCRSLLCAYHELSRMLKFRLTSKKRNLLHNMQCKRQLQLRCSTLIGKQGTWGTCASAFCSHISYRKARLGSSKCRMQNPKTHFDATPLVA